MLLKKNRDTINSISDFINRVSIEKASIKNRDLCIFLIDYFTIYIEDELFYGVTPLYPSGIRFHASFNMPIDFTSLSSI